MEARLRILAYCIANPRGAPTGRGSVGHSSTASASFNPLIHFLRTLWKAARSTVSPDRPPGERAARARERERDNQSSLRLRTRALVSAVARLKPSPPPPPSLKQIGLRRRRWPGESRRGERASGALLARRLSQLSEPVAQVSPSWTGANLEALQGPLASFATRPPARPSAIQAARPSLAC